MTISAPAVEKPWTGPGTREFIAMMAALMAANALTTDAMLPALPAIGAALDVHPENKRQLVITFFLLGFGAAQIFYGPISDRFGRKPILAISLVCYIGCAALCAFAASFTLLLAARVLHGIAAAGSRVLVVSIVRDRFQGEAMARVMSFTTIVFMLVPVLAPSLGQLILAFSGWRAIFLLLGVYGAIVLAWSMVRLPETLAEHHRRPLSLAKVREAFAMVLGLRLSIGNTLAMTLIVGALFGFINSIQQIMFDVFHAEAWLGIIFASIAGTMAITSYLNSRFVQRFGMHRILFAGLYGFVAITALHLLTDLMFKETLLRFVIFQALCISCFGLISANLSTIAMQPLGHIAGTASSVQGVITTLGGAIIGLVIGQAFDGSTLPLVIGFFLCGLIALFVARWSNRPDPAMA